MKSMDASAALDGKIIRGWDSALFKRIMAYAKPYRLFFILAVIFLGMSTAGEMLVPVLIQKAVDRDILPYHQRIFLPEAENELLERLDTEEAEGKQIDKYLYLPSEALSPLTVKEKEDLISRGVLSAENYFLVNTREGEDQKELLQSREQDIHSGANYAAVKDKDLNSFSKAEIRTLRSQHYTSLHGKVVIFIVILVAVLFASFGEIFFMALVSQRVMKDLRTDLFSHTVRLRLHFLDKNPVGSFVSRITNDVETINELFTTVIISFLKDFSLMGGVFVTLFLLNYRLALAAVLFLPPLLIITLFYRVKAREAFRKVRASVSALNAYLSEHISGMRVVQLFVRELRSYKQFKERNTGLLTSHLREMYVIATFRPIVDVFATFSIAAIIYFGASWFLSNLVTLGVLIAFINLIRKFFNPVLDLTEKYNILQQAMAGSERVFTLMDTQEFIPEPKSPVKLPEKSPGEVVFDKVCFQYIPGEPVIRDLSFTVHPGETIAVVGFTGAGKTTLTSLLTRLWDIQEGNITIDGTDIREIAKEDLRRRVQSVLQDVFLFSGSVLENIRMGKEIPMEKIEEAARLVHADGFIRALSSGYETLLQERGGNLSTGQRQLLSFARVLSHNPEILVLDEATSNIDAETDKLIQDALSVLLKDRTAIVIAHRLSTIKNADRILVLHMGKLVEAGKHEELMKKKAAYYNLYKMQYKEE